MAVWRRALRRCQLGGRFSRCKNESINSCQYCGRDFCKPHAFVVEHIEAVCARNRCMLKHENMVQHEEYKAEIAGRNGSGHCGEPECTELHPKFQCSMCNGFFCRPHLRDRMYAVQDGYVKIDKPVSICTWCWGRRKVWSRR